MSNDKTERIVAFQKEIIDRMPANLNLHTRMAIIEAIEAYVDSADPNETSLTWHVRSAYMNEEEPPAAMVIALALCYRSGRLEGNLKEAQLAYYNQHVDVAHHLAEWTFSGILEIASMSLKNTQSGGVNGSVPTIAASTHENEDELQEIPSSRATSKGKGKRVAPLEDSEGGEDPSKKRSKNIEINHVDDENTPRLNLLVRRKSPVKFFDARFSRCTEEHTPAPEKTLNLNKTDFPRVPLRGDRDSTADTMLNPRNPTPVRGKAGPRLQADRLCKEPKAVQNRVKVQLKQKIDKTNADLSDKLSHMEMLRSEHEKLLANQPVKFDEKTMSVFITTSQDLSSRIMKYQEDVLRGMIEADRAQKELTAYTIKTLEERVSAMATCLKAIGDLAGLEATLHRLPAEVDD